MSLARLGFVLFLFIFVVVGFGGSYLEAGEAVVHRKDGRSSTGTVIKDDETGITLDIVGIPLFISRDEIQRVEYKQTIKAQFEKKRKELADEDLEGRYALAKWLMSKREFSLALQETEEMVRRFPTDLRLAQLKRNLIARRAMIRKASAERALSPAERKKATPKRAEMKRTDEKRLTAAQINLIKVWETDLSRGKRPRVHVPQRTIDDLFRAYARDPDVPKGTKAQRAFSSKKGYEQLALVLKLDARDLLHDVRITDEPQALRTYRTKIHQPFVLNYCGTRNCHGAEEARGIRLIRTNQSQEQTAYTNFYILHLYQNAGGYIIDRDYPEDSLLLQYGMPVTDAKWPHPEVEGWHPFFRARGRQDDPRLTNAIEWIRSLQHPLKAKRYGIRYNLGQPPSGRSAETDDQGGDVPAKSRSSGTDQ